MTRPTPFGVLKQRQPLLHAAVKLAAAPAVIPMASWLTGVTILPSAAYHRMTLCPKMFLAILISVLLVMAVARMRHYVRLGFAEYVNRRPLFWALFLVTPLIGAVSATGMILAPPLLVAMIAQDPVALEYTIAKTEVRLGKSCRRAVMVAELGFFDRTLCHVPVDLWKDLAVGDRVAISGRGSRLGVLVYPWAMKNPIIIKGRSSP